MPTLLGPWNVQYPINFVANGDTVHEGFNKHIQEIARIYGLLNALDAGKADTSDLTALRDSLIAAIEAASGGPVPDIFMSDLTNHINSSNPHPNLLLSNTKGNLPVSRVDGLTSYLQSWVEGLGGGVSDESIGTNGYLKFKNGFMIVWGTVPAVSNDTHDYAVTFHKAFPNACFCLAGCVVDSTNRGTGSDGASHNFGNMITMRVKSLSKTGFTLYFHYFERRYIAIGY